MPKKFTQKEMQIRIDKIFDSKLVMLENYKSTVTPVLLKCLVCDKEYKAHLNRVLVGSGCSACSYRKRSRSPEDYNRLVKDGSKDLLKVIGTYINKRTKILHECGCGNQWMVTPNSIITNNFPTCIQCRHKSVRANFKYKTTKLNGKLVEVQGFEPQAINYLIANKLVLEKNLVVESSYNMPIIKYIDIDNKERNYFPDILDKKTMTIYEVKSTWTIGLNNIKIFKRFIKKCLATIKEGYTYRVILGFRDKSCVILPKIVYNMTHKEFKVWYEHKYGGLYPNG